MSKSYRTRPPVNWDYGRTFLATVATYGLVRAVLGPLGGSWFWMYATIWVVLVVLLHFLMNTRVVVDEG